MLRTGRHATVFPKHELLLALLSIFLEAGECTLGSRCAGRREGGLGEGCEDASLNWMLKQAGVWKEKAQHEEALWGWGGRT